MTRRRRTSPPLSLPEEIWKKVASCMDVRDWARASGLCKTTWGMQLQSIKLSDYEGFSLSGLQWISARWGHAQSMCIEMDSKAMADFLAALLHEDGGTDRPQELLQLQMVCEYTETDADSLEPIGRLLAHLAHRAEGLRLLCLTSSKLPTLPQLPSLKHLILDQGSMPITAIARSLLELTALETLYIKCDTEDEDKSCAAYADCPELALATLRYLRHVNLIGLVPSRLTLPPGAALHVTVTHWEAAHDSVWHSVLPMLRSFTWDDPDGDMREMPDLVERAGNITNIELNLQCIGDDRRPLQVFQVFQPNVKVSIRCWVACMDLWGGTWRHMSLVTNHLFLDSWQHPRLEYCSDFYLEYSSLEGSQSSTARACSKSKKLCNGRKCLVKGANLYSEDPRCICGACLSCLMESGKMVDDPCFR